MIWKNKKKTFAISLENYIEKDFGEICLLPFISIFWSEGDTVSINFSLFIGEIQFWFGKIEDLT